MELVPGGTTGPVWKIFGFAEASPLEALPLLLAPSCDFPSSFFARSGFVHFLLNPPNPPPFVPMEKPFPFPVPFPFPLEARAVTSLPKALEGPFKEKP